MSIDYEAFKNPETTTRRTDTDQQEVLTMIQPSDAQRLEIAQDVMGCLIALRSESIFYERKKAEPNAEIISLWKAERNTLFDLTRSLNCNDRDTIENVIATYGPSARALFDQEGSLSS
ncbi:MULTISPECIES: hypothetical protein [Pseudomonas syringae group]|nr:MULTISPECIES: hypothetical protein [Pseudomonas syringae group]MDT3228046.1 hypothetical protein [Pseudomonas amygdali pv. morsprunorum]MDT3244427.1 hypothetical protein [Pseudomonas amygdali pv. morsprunorum]MDT3268263.1 hypothetical protein [Pseudomonas amygdali pv. morsprunorum]RMO19911.1 hypothetical protein ALQ45_101099 [Pseudomonas amygdali pv. morsprunorum]